MKDQEPFMPLPATGPLDKTTYQTLMQELFKHAAAVSAAVVPLDLSDDELLKEVRSLRRHPR